MYELPLFPLNSVLFPGMPIKLHIFEDRYKQMIHTCIEENQPFGVVLIRKGLEAHGPLAEPYRIGCTAQISEVQRLAGGRMNLQAEGQERFRIVSLNPKSMPYLVGKVENYPLLDSGSEEAARMAVQLRSWMERYLSMMVEAGARPVKVGRLPHEPASLAYTGAALTQISPTQKQELLTLGSAAELIERLEAIFRREVALLRAMRAERGRAEAGTFSVN